MIENTDHGILNEQIYNKLFYWNEELSFLKVGNQHAVTPRVIGQDLSDNLFTGMTMVVILFSFSELKPEKVKVVACGRIHTIVATGWFAFPLVIDITSRS